MLQSLDRKLRSDTKKQQVQSLTVSLTLLSG
jgi:hypothetical protein